MSCDFKPGDKVICVLDDGAPELVRGRTYFVTMILLGGSGVRVSGANPSEWWKIGFYSYRFRKVQRRNSSLTIEAFLTIKSGQPEGPTRTPSKEKAKEKAQ